MGDQTGQAVSGQLFYAPTHELRRIVGLQIPQEERVGLFATLARLNTLYMIARAGSGHIGSSFSSLDIVSWLHLVEMNRVGPVPDLYFSSKGHDAPGLYSVLIGLGELDEAMLHRLRRHGGMPGHPDIQTPGIVANTGSLGMGISKAKGIAAADRLRGIRRRVFVLTGDGELQEGQIWESLLSAANRSLDEVTVIVDHNRLQSDTFVSQVNDVGDLAAKFRSFGWHVARCDGHDLASLGGTLSDLNRIAGKPKVLIADTVKGAGVSFMAHTAMAPGQEFYRFHSGAPSPEDYHRALRELQAAADSRLLVLRQDPLELKATEQIAPVAAAPATQRLVPAYGRALLGLAERRKDIVALDADLILDTGMIAFRDRFPDRFFECGIAEQDMVSQAGAMARQGLLPFVHSFACFLSARPNEQIYNNATERTKVIYVGSLAGIVPGGPGHSHQAVRDIAALSAIPGLVMFEPSCEREVDMAVEWCASRPDGSVYLRLVSIPCAIDFTLPDNYCLNEGHGVVLQEGTDIVLFAYGPILLPEALAAAKKLEALGVTLKVVNCPWLNRIDGGWLRRTIGTSRLVVTLDNHYRDSGQGAMIAAAIAENGISTSVLRLGIRGIPECGRNDEVLAAHGLDAVGIAAAIGKFLSLE